MEERIKRLERQKGGGERMEEKIEKITEKVSELIEKGKEEQQQGERVECRREIGEEVKEMKRRIEEKEKKERKNNMVIRGLKQGKSDLKEEAKTFLEKEFGVKESVRKVQVIRKEGRKEIVLVEMENWEEKEKIKERANYMAETFSSTMI